MASETLEALRHSQGPLLDLFLALMMSNLTFQEVVDCILYENRCDAQCLLDDLRACHALIHEELDDLIKAHREESDKSSRKRIKKEIDLRCKDLESLRECISYHESHLEQDPGDDGLFGHGAEAEMATAPGVMTLLQRAPRLKPLIPLQLKVKPMPWRWMTRVFAHLQLAPSPLWKMIY